MNWQKVNLNDPYESNQNLLDPYDFDTLLLEIECNLPLINTETVKKQAILSIKNKYQTALDILNDNLDNITKHALKTRAIK